MEIKVLSLNLYEGGLLHQELYSFLLNQKPDILFFQEAYAGGSDKLPPSFRSVSVLTQLFPDYSFSFVPSFLISRAEGVFEFGNLILSKFPIKTVKSTFFGKYGVYPLKPKDGNYAVQPKLMQMAQIKVAGKVFFCGNVHGIWGFNGQDNHARIKMSHKIVQQIKNKKNIILAGDFNVQPHTQTIAQIENKLNNVFKNQLRTTFNLKRKNLKKHPGYASAIVDYIFLSKNIKLLKKNIPQVDVSDHLPLVVEISTN